jgi:dTDP-4-amino-4,6-dideoxygalactose transaminase
MAGLGIGPGDEVITVPNTFIATAEAISFTGAQPVFVDVDETTYTMDPAKLEDAITSHTRAIIPVHLYGQTADMDPIMDIARARGLYVIEDACQAHGAAYRGKVAGSIGDAGCFSFYPGKNMGAYGEAGAVVTNNSELYEAITMLRDHGQNEKYYHRMIGWNARMDGFQGAILNVKLKYITSWNDSRRANADRYTKMLGSVGGVIVPSVADYASHVYHVYAVRVKNREALMAKLAEKDIYCGIHYPVPVHLQNAYRFLGLARGSFPVAEQLCEETLSLPMFPELRTEQIDFVASELEALLRNKIPLG